VIIRLKRVYEPAERGDGARFLVERLWPRGTKKETLDLQAWLKDVAPSVELRRWFAHDQAKWREFRRRYVAELNQRSEAWQPILAAARRGAVTLLYSARDTRHNSAVVLAEYLSRRLAVREQSRRPDC
jgi:uncharacterized protein YeaO (DUF488 family)